MKCKAINPIEMVMEAVTMVQKRFYEDYPPHPKEVEYNYKCSSTMKPTQVQVRRSFPTSFFSIFSSFLKGLWRAREATWQQEPST